MEKLFNRFRTRYRQSYRFVLALFLIYGIAFNTSTADSSGSTDSKSLPQEQVQDIYQRAWWLLSQIHKDMTVLDEAIDLYKKVAADDPGNYVVFWKLSEATFKKAEATKNEEKREELYEKALDYARQSLKLNPDSIEAHFWIGTSSAKLAEMVGTFSALGVINEAIKELKITLKMDPDHRFAVIAGAALAAIYSQAPWPIKDLEDAEMYAAEAVKKDPNLTLASSTLASVYLERDKLKEARLEAERCLSLGSPTYIWDAELYNWPWARRLLKKIDEQE